MNAPIVGVGRVMLWTGGSLWIGRDTGRAEAHDHHAIQISLALTGRLRLGGVPEATSDGVAGRGAADRRNGIAGRDVTWSEYELAVVPSHHRHEFDGARETLAQVFVEPETAQGHALATRFPRGDVRRADVAATGTLRDDLRAAFDRGDEATMIALAHRLVAVLSGVDASQPNVDPRVARAIEFVRSRLDTAVSLQSAAAVAHLSPSRFRHLFVAQTGISFRAYLLWARVEAAIGAGMRGLSWTEAAQTCGFADSAHFTRTCRRMFGISPRMLVPGD